MRGLRQWTADVARLVPGALVTHRTAWQCRPDAAGIVIVTSTRDKVIVDGDLTIQVVRGPAARPDDPPLLDIRMSSLPRSLLENLSGSPHAAPSEDVERRLERMLRDGGDVDVLTVRDLARGIAEQLNWQSAYHRLEALVAALLGIGTVSSVTSASARARARSRPFDPACIDRLGDLATQLRAAGEMPVATSSSPSRAQHKPFFEAYFSCFIEGITYDVEYARALFQRSLGTMASDNAVDLLSAFDIVNDTIEMQQTPSSPDDLLAILRRRHIRLLAHRPAIHPGTLKQRQNRAGETNFVRPEEVVGTLREGFTMYAELPPGFPRAIFMMFLVSDVHPFDDGNGRVARLMMNAELAATGASTIIIPTVFREDYLLALRALTRRGNATPLVDAMALAARFSNLDFSDYPTALAELRRRNWFREPDEAKIIIET